MKCKLIIAMLLLCLHGNAQELYVFSEPASNMPAHAVTAKLTDHIVTANTLYNRVTHRLMPEIQIGINKKWMIHTGVSFANMHTPDFRYESVNLYTKYRFLSKDDVHAHFRMAVFADASVTQAPFHYEEISLMGDKSGIQLGLIATQLKNRFAISATVSHTQVLDESRTNKAIYIPKRAYQAMNYSISSGYLVLPKEYSSYRQTNLNLYAEVLAQQTLDVKRSYVDFAPALQLIFNSNTKLNIGYRFQLAGNMDRMTRNSWQLSIERTFLK